eukprot:3872472-Amphidinium_carterae.1
MVLHFLWSNSEFLCSFCVLCWRSTELRCSMRQCLGEVRKEWAWCSREGKEGWIPLPFLLE